MNTIVVSILVLAIMGLVFGMILAFASMKFSIDTDERVEAVLEALPGANCGGCGFPGCGNLASSIVNGDAPVNGCPVGGASVAAKIGEIMGIKVKTQEKKVAKVMCKGDCDNSKNKYIYEGITDCRTANALNSGAKSCKFGCLGLGTCKDVCQFGAIIIENGLAKIDEEKCVECGKCVTICPKNIIKIKPVNKQVVVECSSNDFGKDVKENCSVGCIGCGVCAKVCQFDAIIFKDKLASVDYSKCTSCMECVKKCPTKVIKGKFER